MLLKKKCTFFFSLLDDFDPPGFATVTFDAGVSDSMEADFSIVDDLLDEETEGLTLQIISVSNGGVIDSNSDTARGLIFDNDGM